MATPVYEHRTQGKTLVCLTFLSAAIATVLLGSSFGAPIYWYIPIGFILLFGAWHFMSNPDHGCVMTDATLEVWSNTLRHTFQLDQIERVEAKTWSDGPDDFTLVMKDGSEVALSHLQIGKSADFRAHLEILNLNLVSKT